MIVLGVSSDCGWGDRIAAMLCGDGMIAVGGSFATRDTLGSWTVGLKCGGYPCGITVPSGDRSDGCLQVLRWLWRLCDILGGGGVV